MLADSIFCIYPTHIWALHADNTILSITLPTGKANMEEEREGGLVWVDARNVSKS